MFVICSLFHWVEIYILFPILSVSIAENRHIRPTDMVMSRLVEWLAEESGSSSGSLHNLGCKSLT